MGECVLLLNHLWVVSSERSLPAVISEASLPTPRRPMMVAGIMCFDAAKGGQTVMPETHSRLVSSSQLVCIRPNFCSLLVCFPPRLLAPEHSQHKE